MEGAVVTRSREQLDLCATREAAVLAAVTQCAESGWACPSDSQLAATVGGISRVGARYVLLRLEARGLVSLSHVGRLRIVTIIETGKSTALPSGKDGYAAVAAEKKAQREHSAHVVAFSQPQPVRVDREPCPLCAVRSDIGCRHTRAAARFTFVPVRIHFSEVAHG